MVTDAKTYLAGLIADITRLADSGRRTLYRPNEELHPDVVSYLRKYLPDIYALELYKCKTCTNVWDVIVEW